LLAPNITGPPVQYFKHVSYKYNVRKSKMWHKVPVVDVMLCFTEVRDSLRAKSTIKLALILAPDF